MNRKEVLNLFERYFKTRGRPSFGKKVLRENFDKYFPKLYYILSSLENGPRVVKRVEVLDGSNTNTGRPRKLKQLKIIFDNLTIRV